MQPERDAPKLAETLLAVTLSATSALKEGDWATVRQLLQRRTQLLDQLDGCRDLQASAEQLRKVQDAEHELALKINSIAEETLADLSDARGFRTARKAYKSRRPGPRFIERFG